MGKGSAQTLTEVEQIRARLERDVADLEERLPETTRWAKRAAAVAVGGGIGMRTVRFVIKRRRRKAGVPENGSGHVPSRLLWAAAGAGMGAAAVALKTRPTHQDPFR